jgi:hypothetical protein
VGWCTYSPVSDHGHVFSKDSIGLHSYRAASLAAAMTLFQQYIELDCGHEPTQVRLRAAASLRNITAGRESLQVCTVCTTLHDCLPVSRVCSLPLRPAAPTRSPPRVATVPHPPPARLLCVGGAGSKQWVEAGLLVCGTVRPHADLVRLGWWGVSSLVISRWFAL